MPQRTASRNAFHSLLLRSVVVPVVLMGLLAIVLIWQIGHLMANARWVEHTDRVITHLYLLEKLHVDRETGLRGYLITGDEATLAPYFEANARIKTSMESAKRLIADQADSTARLAIVEELSAQWGRYGSAQISRRKAAQIEESFARVIEGKSIMDKLREKFKELVDVATAERAERNSKIERSAIITSVGVGVLAVVVGVAMSLLSRTQLKWLSMTYEESLNQTNALNAELEQRVDARTRELSLTNGQLNEANKELEAFAYSVSHDLRAPMRHITGFSSLLRMSLDGKLTEDDSENLETIHRTAVLAGRMVDDLLAFSRVGRTDIRHVEIDMDTVVKNCQASLAPEIANRRIEWKTEPLSKTAGDPALIRMVVSNLLANAVKYTSTREVAEIEVSSRSENDGVTYVIRDNGVGFDMTYVHKLFGVFQRLHRAEEFEGTGIGLANVRRIILRHDGQVWAEGIPNAAAAFYFHLPDRVQKQTEEAATSASEVP